MGSALRVSPTMFYGDPNFTTSLIDVSGGILMSRTSGQTPAFVQVSACNILATGTVLDGKGNALIGAPIQSITWSGGIATVTTVNNHPYPLRGPLQQLQIRGATPAGYNTTALCTITGENTFTYPLAIDPGGPSLSGAWTAMRAWERLEYSWDFGDPTGNETFTDPRSNLLVNANTDQYGPEALYCYRTPGTKTITLKVRGLDGTGGYVAAQATASFHVFDFYDAGSGNTHYYFDSVNGNNNNSGRAPNQPKKDLWGTTPAVRSTGVMVASNCSINLAYGSSWTNATGKGTQNAVLSIAGTGVSGIRVAAYANRAPGNGTNNPKLITAVGNNAAILVNPIVGDRFINYSDVVFSDLDLISTSTEQASGSVLVRMSRGAHGPQRQVAIFKSDISDGTGLAPGPFMSYALWNTIKGIYAIQHGAPIYDNTGAVPAGTLIGSPNGSLGYGSGVNAFFQFTGSITNGVLTILKWGSQRAPGRPIGMVVFNSVGAAVGTITSGNFPTYHLNNASASETMGLMTMATVRYAATAIFTGFISDGAGKAGNTLTVSGTQFGAVTAGQTIYDPMGAIAWGTTITAGLGGGRFTVSGAPQLTASAANVSSYTSTLLVSNEMMMSTFPSKYNAVFKGSIGNWTGSPGNYTGTLTVSHVQGGINIGDAILDLTNAIDQPYHITSPNGENWHVSSKAQTTPPNISAELMFSGSPGGTVTDIYFDHLNLDMSAVPGGGAFGFGSNGVDDAVFFGPEVYSNIAVYGCNCNVVNRDGTGLPLTYGAHQWMSWFGLTLNCVGTATRRGPVWGHQINPETAHSHQLCRWTFTGCGDLTNSRLNFAFHPRVQNFFNGTVYGENAGRFVLIADNKFTMATNGCDAGNEALLSPYTNNGYYDTVIVERTDFSEITQEIWSSSGVINNTVRDCRAWNFGNFVSPADGAPPPRSNGRNGLFLRLRLSQSNLSPL